MDDTSNGPAGLPKLPYPAAPVAELRAPTRAELAAAIERAEPVKITHALGAWPLHRALRGVRSPLTKLEILGANAPADPVRFSISPPGAGGNFGLGLGAALERGHYDSTREVPLHRFLEWARKFTWNGDAGALYMRSQRVRSFESGIRPLPMLRDLVPASDARFWLGTGGQVVPLHNDPDRNLLAMLSGHKRIVLFPPRELTNLYPAPLSRHQSSVFASLVDVFAPDLDRHPRLARALEAARVVDLAPGEAVYLPPLWWHAVHSAGLNFSVNCWFFDDGRRARIRSLHRPGFRWTEALRAVREDELAEAADAFSEALGGGSAPAAAGKRHVATARRIGAQLRGFCSAAELTEPQRRLWREWLDAYYALFAFRRFGDAFPALPGEPSERTEAFTASSVRRDLLLRARQGVLRAKRYVEHRAGLEHHPLVPSSRGAEEAAAPTLRVRPEQLHAAREVPNAAYVEHDARLSVGDRVHVVCDARGDFPPLDGVVDWLAPEGVGSCGFGVVWIGPARDWERVRRALGDVTAEGAAARLSRIFGS